MQTWNLVTVCGFCGFAILVMGPGEEGDRPAAERAMPWIGRCCPRHPRAPVTAHWVDSLDHPTDWGGMGEVTRLPLLL
jgi:hypothetical protein